MNINSTDKGCWRCRLPIGRRAVHVRATAGFTLIELIVVMSIIAILLVAMGFEFVGWRAKFRAEGDVKMLYTDLTKSRLDSIQTKSLHFVNIPEADETVYKIFKDNDPFPDGDGILDDAVDAEVTSNALSYFINTPLRHFAFTRGGLLITDSGVLQGTSWIRLEGIDSDGSHGSPGSDVDCVSLVSTRINTGWFDESLNECVER